MMVLYGGRGEPHHGFPVFDNVGVASNTRPYLSYVNPTTIELANTKEPYDLTCMFPDGKTRMPYDKTLSFYNSVRMRSTWNLPWQNGLLSSTPLSNSWIFVYGLPAEDNDDLYIIVGTDINPSHPKNIPFAENGWIYLGTVRITNLRDNQEQDKQHHCPQCFGQIAKINYDLKIVAYACGYYWLMNNFDYVLLKQQEIRYGYSGKIS